MSGSAGAHNLTGVIPGAHEAQASQAAAVAPDLGAMSAGAGAPQATPAEPSPQDIMQAIQSAAGGDGGAAVQGAPQTQPGEPTPEEMYAAIQHAAGGEAPAPQPSSMASKIGMALLSPLGAALNAASSPGEAPPTAQILSKFAKHPEGQRQIFQNIAGAGFESRVAGEKVEFRKAGESDWKAIDPGWFSSIHGFVTRLADFAPEILEGAVMGGTIASGAAEGAAAGGVATAPAGGLGAIPGAVAGAIGSGVVGATAAGAAREAASRLLGADADPNLGANLALQAGTGGLLGGAGMLLRRPAQVAAHWLSEQAASSTAAVAEKAAGFAQKFNTIYQEVAGRGTPSTEEAGKFAQTAIGSATKQLGERVGQVWDTLLPKSGDVIKPTPKFQQILKETLEDRGFSFELADQIPGEPIVNKLVMKAPKAGEGFTKVSDPGLAALHDLMGEQYIAMDESKGMALKDLKSMHARLQELAGFDSPDPSAVQKTYRALYGALREDRNTILQGLSQGTELEGIASKAFSDYADKIDDLRLVSRAAEKSPEKFVNWMFKDADTAKLAKNVMSNGLDDVEAMNGWDAVRGSWLKKQMTNAMDEKTGIVDLTKLHDTLIGKGGVTDKSELAKVVMGEGKLEELRRLGLAMARTSWEKLLAKPDSAESAAMLRAFTKFGLSGGRTAYGVDALGALVGHDGNILAALNHSGVMNFAQEAATLQEKNYWLRASKMLSRLADGGIYSMPGAKGAAKIPVEQSMIPVLLNAGVRPVSEDPGVQQGHVNYASQMYQEKLQERAREVEANLRQAQVQAQRPQGFPAVQLSSQGTGIPPQYHPLNAFAGKGRKR